MKKSWRLDPDIAIELELSPMGREIARLNGAEIYNKRVWRTRNDIHFTLPAGQQAQLTVRTVGLSPTVELLVGGQFVPEEQDARNLACPNCDAPIKPLEQFCERCGTRAPDARNPSLKKTVREATMALPVLAGLFLISGVVLFFVQREASQEALQNLANLPADAPYPDPIHGVTYSVAQLRQRITWELWGALVVNVVLAAIMIGLSFWGKRAPLPALIVGASVYAVVVTGNAIADPRSLAHGWLLKFIIVTALYRGIKAALELRAQTPQPAE